MEKIHADKINSALCCKDKRAFSSRSIYPVVILVAWNNLLFNYLLIIIFSLFSHLQNAMPTEQCIKQLVNMTECPWKG